MQQSNEILEYDGSFAGFLCCVHYVFKRKQMPQFILTSEQAENSLFSGFYIETDEQLARRIELRLQRKLRKDNFHFIKKGFFSSLENKEICLLQVIEIALDCQDSLRSHTYQPVIDTLYRALRMFDREIGHYCGFVRFSEVNHYLIATIKPQYCILPWLLPYFVKRYGKQSFGIYDQTHQLLGLSEEGNVSIRQVSAEIDLAITEDELQIQKQWQLFFKTVAIEERENKRAQMNHMPKRYWDQLTEFQNNPVEQ